ncbi:MAG TPA: hypothetical protein V6D14_19305 [Coleofasciculaceae cyanobacterium]|jgi:hypothetical protein
MLKRVILTTFLITFASAGMAQAQWRPYPVNPDGNLNRDRNGSEQLRGNFDQLLSRIQSESRTFSRTLDRALDDSPLDGTKREDNLNQLTNDLRADADRVRDRFRRRDPVRDDVQRLLERAQRIELIMQRLPRNTSNRGVWRDALRDWTNLRADLNQLESVFSRVDRFDQDDRFNRNDRFDRNDRLRR